MMRKASTHVATMARKPRTTMTAIAQWGKMEPAEVGWRFPEEVELGAVVRVAVRAADAEDADAAEADEEAIDAMTESA